MSHLILVRHGQSEWNLQNRFTGWVDVDLTANGKLEACKAGELIKDLNIEISHFYTSYQKRALNTLKLILNTIRVKNEKILKAWELNERHYGELTGLNKDEMKKKYGRIKFLSLGGHGICLQDHLVKIIHIIQSILRYTMTYQEIKYLIQSL